MADAKAKRSASAEYVLRPPSDPRTANMRRRVARANRYGGSSSGGASGGGGGGGGGDTTATDQSDLDNERAKKSSRQSRQKDIIESDPELDTPKGGASSGRDEEDWIKGKDAQVDDQGLPFDYVEYRGKDGGYQGDDRILRKSPRTSGSSYSMRHQRDAMDALSLGPSADVTGAKVKSLGKRRGPTAAAWRKKVQEEDLDTDSRRVAVYCMSGVIDLKQVLTKLNALESTSTSTTAAIDGTGGGASEAAGDLGITTDTISTTDPPPSSSTDGLINASPNCFIASPTASGSPDDTQRKETDEHLSNDTVHWSNVVFDEAVHSTTGTPVRMDDGERRVGFDVGGMNDEDAEENHERAGSEGRPQKDIFTFAYGCIVFWGLTRAEELSMLTFIAPYSQEPTSKYEREASHDVMDFAYKPKPNVVGARRRTRVAGDEIFLTSSNALEKFAVSCSLAQSAKLFVFERRLESTIDSVKQIPEELAETGKVTLTRKELSRMFGKLFIARTQVNLHSDILDEPDFLWDNDYWEETYEKMGEYLDISNRVDLLNKRADLIRELLDVIENQLQLVDKGRSASHETALVVLLSVLVGVVTVLGALAVALLYTMREREARTLSEIQRSLQETTALVKGIG